MRNATTPHTTNADPHQKADVQPQPIENIVLMSWAEWAATPKDYRLTSLYGRAGRWVMRAGPKGPTLYPVHITG